MDKEYTFGFHCKNCGENGVVIQRHGTPRPDMVECLNCGCMAETNTYIPENEKIRLGNL